MTTDQLQHQKHIACGFYVITRCFSQQVQDPCRFYPDHWYAQLVRLDQRFPNFFQVGTTFISQNVLRTTPTLVPFESKLFKILNYSVWYAIHVNFIFFCLLWTNVQSKRTTRAEPEDHLWSADHSLGNVGLDHGSYVYDTYSTQFVGRVYLRLDVEVDIAGL
jgi:hypothetical protein